MTRERPSRTGTSGMERVRFALIQRRRWLFFFAAPFLSSSMNFLPLLCSGALSSGSLLLPLQLPQSHVALESELCTRYGLQRPKQKPAVKEEEEGGREKRKEA